MDQINIQDAPPGGSSGTAVGGPDEDLGKWRYVRHGLWVVGIVMLAFGAIGWYQRTVEGLYYTHLGSIVPWGLWVSVYIFCIGASAGSFLISSLVYVFGVKRFEAIGRQALFTAIVTLMMAMAESTPDIGHMERFWHVMAYPNLNSVMAWIPHLYGLYFLVMAAELWFLMRADLVACTPGEGLKCRIYRILTLGSKDVSPESKARDHRYVKVLATVGIPVAIMFHGGMGALFGVIAARPSWNSGLFPLLFLLSALASGGALLLGVTAVFEDGWRRHADTIVALGRLVLGLFLLDLLFQLSEILVASYGGHVPADGAALNIMLHGPYSWVFWGWQLGVGSLIPVIILVAPTRKDPRWVGAAGLLIAAGFIGARLNIVIPELMVEELKGLAEAIASPRLQASYFPSLNEFMVSSAVIGFGLLVFGLADRLGPHAHDPLPPLPADEG